MNFSPKWVLLLRIYGNCEIGILSYLPPVKQIYYHKTTKVAWEYK
jgi:hypothetical protein